MPTSRRRSTKAASSAKPVARSRQPRARRSPAVAAATEEGAIVLAGPPGRLRATVSVENTVDQRVTVRGLLLHRDDAPTVSGAATALIPPGATADVPVTFRLDPTTPPGETGAQVEVAGMRRTARVVVEPEPSVRVSPRRMLATPGRQPVTLVVTNDGNVPVPIAPLTRARTDDGGPDPGPDVDLSVADPPTVEPGRTATVAAELAVPDDLDPTRRHLARIPVGTADLDVIILPRTAPEAPS